MINKYEAPGGYIAVKSTNGGCRDCVYEHCTSTDIYLMCLPEHRRDKEEVVFVKAPIEQVMQGTINGGSVKQIDAESLLREFDSTLKLLNDKVDSLLVLIKEIDNKTDDVLGRV